MSLRSVALAGALSLLPVVAFAQNSANYPMYPAQDAASSSQSGLFGQPDGTFSAGVKAGTLGIGGEVGYRPLTMFGVRIDGEAFSFSDNITAGRATYHATAELQSYGALADLYPFAGSFRLTGGLRLNENEINGNSTSVQIRTAGITTTAPTSEFGSLDGRVTFDKLSPYVGFGWGGTIAPGLNLTTDFGVMFHGNPKASVNGSLTPAGAGVPTILDTGINAGLASARSDLQHQVDGYDYFPVIEIGLVYKF